MALATRCPHCHTTFRVAVDQLKLRGGIVRCGQCSEIFDGNACIVDLSQPDALTPPPDEVPVYELDLAHALDKHGVLPAPEAEAPTPAPAPAPAIPEFTLDLIEDETPPAEAPTEAPVVFADLLARQLAQQAPTPAPTAAPTEAPLPLPPSPPPIAEPELDLDLNVEPPTAYTTWKPRELPASDTAPVSDPRFDAPEQAGPDTEPSERIEPTLAPAPNTPGSDPAGSDPIVVPRRLDLVVADEDDDEPEFVKRGREEEQSGRRRRILLSLGSVVLVLGLLVQGALQWRHQLALQQPALRQPLTQLAGLFGLRIDLPAQIDQLSIETGELQTLAGGIHSYTTLLRNTGALPQAWPAIELRLRDEKRQLLLRRVLFPKDYLPAGTDPAKGFAARAEQAVQLHFDLGKIAAAGYDVGIFYP